MQRVLVGKARLHSNFHKLLRQDASVLCRPLTYKSDGFLMRYAGNRTLSHSSVCTRYASHITREFATITMPEEPSLAPEQDVLMDSFEDMASMNDKKDQRELLAEYDGHIKELLLLKRNGDLNGVVNRFRLIKERGFTPNAFAYNIVFQAFATKRPESMPLNVLVTIHREMVASKMFPDSFGYQCLLAALCNRDTEVRKMEGLMQRNLAEAIEITESESLSEEKLVREKNRCREFERKLAALKDEGNYEMALALYREATSRYAAHGISLPNQVHNRVLSISAERGDVEETMKTFEDMQKVFNTSPDPLSYSHLITVFAKVGDLESARECYNSFRSIPKWNDGEAKNDVRRKIVWNSMANAYAICGDTDSALNVLRRDMPASGQKPDNISFNIIVNAYGQAGDLKNAYEIVQKMERKEEGYPPTSSITWTTLLFQAAKHKDIALTELALDTLINRYDIPNHYYFMIRIIKLALDQRNPTREDLAVKVLRLFPPRRLVIDKNTFDILEETFTIKKTDNMTPVFSTTALCNLLSAAIAASQANGVFTRTSQVFPRSLAKKALLMYPHSIEFNFRILETLRVNAVKQDEELTLLFMNNYKSARETLGKELFAKNIAGKWTTLTAKMIIVARAECETEGLLEDLRIIFEDAKNSGLILEMMWWRSIVNRITRVPGWEDKQPELIDAFKSHFLFEDAVSKEQTPQESLELQKKFNSIVSNRPGNSAARVSYQIAMQIMDMGYPPPKHIYYTLNWLANLGIMDLLQKLTEKIQSVSETIESDEVRKKLLNDCKICTLVCHGRLGEFDRVLEITEELREQGVEIEKDKFAVAELMRALPDPQRAIEVGLKEIRSHSYKVPAGTYTINVLLGLMAKHRPLPELIKTYDDSVYRYGFTPNPVTYGTMIGACLRHSDVRCALVFYERMDKTFFHASDRLVGAYNAMAQHYILSGDKSNAVRVLNRFEERKIKRSLYTYQLELYAHAVLEPRNLSIASNLLERMQREQLDVRGEHLMTLAAGMIAEKRSEVELENLWSRVKEHGFSREPQLTLEEMRRVLQHITNGQQVIEKLEAVHKNISQ